MVRTVEVTYEERTDPVAVAIGSQWQRRHGTPPGLAYRVTVEAIKDDVAWLRPERMGGSQIRRNPPEPEPSPELRALKLDDLLSFYLERVAREVSDG